MTVSGCAAAGSMRFRQWLASRPNFEASQVMVGNGSPGMLGLLLDEICKPGDTVLIEAPAYDRIPACGSQRAWFRLRRHCATGTSMCRRQRRSCEASVRSSHARRTRGEGAKRLGESIEAA